jgi:FMN hydrolase / 5-amino-6-(5-phospho-D-ribitylamino)uracil phosphatase
MFEVITFDLDDTLWDARPALLRAEQRQHDWITAQAPRLAAAHDNESLRRWRWDLASQRPDVAHDFTALRTLALREQLAAFGYDPALAEPGIALFVHERSVVTLYADVLPVLTDLSRDFMLVALTNGNADLEVAGVSPYFAFCISPAEAGVQKPDPRMFEVALARAGVSAAHAVHVGDQPLYDVEGARRASLASVWLNRGGAPWPAEYTRPQAEISSLIELRAALARLA